MSIISLWDEQAVDVSLLSPAPVQGVPCDILTSADIANQNFDSLRLSVQYEGIIPGEVQGTFSLFAEIDAKDVDNKYRRLGIYQIDQVRHSQSSFPDHTMIMQKNMAVQNLGEPEQIFSGNIPRLSISRFQGSLPAPTEIRVRIVLLEGDVGGLTALQNVTVSADLELYQA